MRALRSLVTSRRRIALLLCLMLLLPLAQAAAAWHALSHLAPDASAELDAKHAPHPAHCDLCLAAAAIGDGAPAADPPSLPCAASHHAAPDAVVSHLAPARPARRG